MSGSGLGCEDAKVSKSWSLYTQKLMACPGGRTDVYRVKAVTLSSVITSHTPSALKTEERVRQGTRLQACALGLGYEG